MTNEKVTIKVAAKALGVSIRTIHRYLDNGQLSRVKDGDRTYVSMDDIRAFRSAKMSQASDSGDSDKKDDVIKTSDTSDTQIKEVVTISLDKYDAMRDRLTYMEGKLIEYEPLALELEQARKKIAELEEQLTKQSWWKFWKK